MTGKELYERYMTNLAGKYAFDLMPPYETLSETAKVAWDAAANINAPVHDHYKPKPAKAAGKNAPPEVPVTPETPVV